MIDPDADAPAGLIRRLAAIIYDLLLLVGLWMVATGALLPFTHGRAVPAGDLLFRLYLTLIAFGFFGLFWTRAGQTLGMKAWRLRLQQPDGRPVTWRQASIRFVVAALSAAAAGLGFLWQLIDAQGRSWHDIASGTVMVRTARRR
ncbi:RDD family protein [Ectothiorhodospiraceae bacterium WFHF3C12]|nr:RDD family protein [Ectothiorhodospiraceae bacterium WFHF3C12]